MKKVDTNKRIYDIMGPTKGGSIIFMKIEKLKMAVVPALILLAVVLFGVILFMDRPALTPVPEREQVVAEGGGGGSFMPQVSTTKLAAFASQNGLSVDDWPEALKELMRKEPASEAFVMNYPFMKDISQEIDMSAYEACTQVPHLLQWDTQWGYTQYGGEMLALNGGGPTCLSMVSIYLLQDTKYTPQFIAAFSEENNYYLENIGTSWSLISEGGPKLGLDVQELPLVWNIIKDHLNEGNPIICVVGPGDFADDGHYIVMSEVVDEKVKILDPNSVMRSEVLWEFEQIQDQIKNLWVCKRPQQ